MDCPSSSHQPAIKGGSADDQAMMATRKPQIGREMAAEDVVVTLSRAPLTCCVGLFGG